MTTTGGGGHFVLELGCTSYGHRNVARVPFTTNELPQGLDRVTIRTTLLPSLGEWTCEVSTPDAPTLLYHRAPIQDRAPPQPLVLGLTASSLDANLVTATLHRVRLHGAPQDSAASQRSPQAIARHHLVEDHPLATLNALGPDDHILAVVALIRMGRLRAATQRLHEALGQGPVPPSVEVILRALLRSEPRIFSALLSEVRGPTSARNWLTETWTESVSIHRSPRGIAVVWAGLAGLDLDHDRFGVLKLYALAAAALGHHDVATATYRAALAALDDPTRHDLSQPDALAQRVAIHLEMAALALARDDLSAARATLMPLLGPDADLRTIDQLRARSDLRPLWPLIPESLPRATMPPS